MSETTTSVAELLKQLVNVNTVDQIGDEESALTILAELFNSVGVSSEIENYREGNANLSAEYQFEQPGPTFVLNSHIDVVPTGPGWATEPFHADERDGKIFGRGSADAKGSLAAMALAFINVIKNPEGLSGRIVYTAVGDEEVGSSGVRALLQDFNADYCVVGEPTNLQILSAHKGSLRPVIQISGVAAHAATPQNGVNAIEGFADFVNIFHTYQAQLANKIHQLTGNPTATIVLINGGEAPNQVPEFCEFTIDRRLIPTETFEEVLQEIETLIADFNSLENGCTASLLQLAPSTGGPSETASDHEFVVKSRNALASIGENAELGGLMVNCDMTSFMAAGIPTYVFGPGTLEVMHAVDEYVEVEQLHRAVVAYEAIIREVLKA